jgi:hypothetical protein
MKIIRDGIWLCVDCLFAAVNGDVSGIDYYLSGDAAEKRVAEIWAGLEKLGPHLVPDFDTEGEENDEGDTVFHTSDGDDGHREFSSCGCDACGSRLAGEFHRFAILGNDDDPPVDECTQFSECVDALQTGLRSLGG